MTVMSLKRGVELFESLQAISANNPLDIRSAEASIVKDKISKEKTR